jgi:hypothetical protein
LPLFIFFCCCQKKPNIELVRITFENKLGFTVVPTSNQQTARVKFVKSENAKSKNITPGMIVFKINGFFFFFFLFFYWLHISFAQSSSSRSSTLQQIRGVF